MTSQDSASREFVRAAERSATLYTLSSEYERLLQLLDQGDEPDEEASTLQLLDQVQGAIETKAESIAGLLRMLEWRARARKDEASRLAEAGRRDEQRVEWLREYLRSNMQTLGLERIETLRFTLTTRLGPPRVEVRDAEQIPSEFRRTITRTEPNKLLIQDHYRQTGEIPPGVEITRHYVLSIR